MVSGRRRWWSNRLDVGPYDRSSSQARGVVLPSGGSARGPCPPEARRRRRPPGCRAPRRDRRRQALAHRSAARATTGAGSPPVASQSTGLTARHRSPRSTLGRVNQWSTVRGERRGHGDEDPFNPDSGRSPTSCHSNQRRAEREGVEAALGQPLGDPAPIHAQALGHGRDPGTDRATSSASAARRRIADPVDGVVVEAGADRLQIARSATGSAGRAVGADPDHRFEQRPHNERRPTARAGGDHEAFDHVGEVDRPRRAVPAWSATQAPCVMSHGDPTGEPRFREGRRGGGGRGGGPSPGDLAAGRRGRALTNTTWRGA